MQIRHRVLRRGRLRHGVAATRIEALLGLAGRSGTVVFTHPREPADRGEHVRRAAPRTRFGIPDIAAVAETRHEHDRGSADAMAFHVDVAATPDVDAAGEV